MRITITTTNFPPDIGGPARQTLEIANKLQQKGHDVQLIVLGQRQPPESLSTEIEFRVIQGPKDIRFAPFRYLSNFVDLLGAIRRFKPDVIHHQIFEYRILRLLLFVTKLVRVPVVAKFTAERAYEVAMAHHKGAVGDPDSIRKTARYKRLKQQDNYFLSRVDRVWVTTPEFAEFIHEVHGIPKDRLFCAPNFTDIATFSRSDHRPKRSDDKLRLLTVCRFTPWKGIQDCIAAGELLSDIDFHWTIIGSGNETTKASIDAELQRSRVADRFELPGAKVAEDIAAALANADIFVLASRYEPFGIVLIEAMGAGVAIAASRVGGIPFVLDYGKAGALFEPADPESIASTIRDLASDRAKRQKLVEAGYQTMLNYDIDLGVDRLVDLYQSMVRN